MLATQTPVHPAAELFPMLDFADLNQLADDIRKNGLIEPIILHDGQVLDGRNRLKACEIADVDPQFVELEDVSSPVLYVLSRNLHRRHLSVSQRAAIGAEIVPMLQEEAKERQIAQLKNHANGSLAPIGANDDTAGKCSEIAAEQVAVSSRSVERATSVKKAAPETFEQVKRGEITLNAADEQVREKRELGTKRQEVIANAHKQRMISGISTVNGICLGLDTLDVEKVIVACDEKEIREWAEKSRELANKLRKFATRLEKAQ